MTAITYPDPGYQYQGANLTLSGLRLGPLALCPARAYGVNYWTDPAVKIPDITLRPVAANVKEDDPCTSQFTIFYTQYKIDPDKGVEWDMIFRLTSDQAGGVIGAEASLSVESNYPEIDMAIPRFKFTQKGFGIQKMASLPGDYQATLTVKFWDCRASVALDGWMMLECGYYREPNAQSKVAAGGFDVTELVAVGRTSLYPAHSADDATPVVGGAYRRR